MGAKGPERTFMSKACGFDFYQHQCFVGSVSNPGATPWDNGNPWGKPWENSWGNRLAQKCNTYDGMLWAEVLQPVVTARFAIIILLLLGQVVGAYASRKMNLI